MEALVEEVVGFNADSWFAQIDFGTHIDIPQYANSEKSCGMIGIRRNVAKGDVRYFTHRCNNFRECKLCFKQRKHDHVKRVRDMLERHSLPFVAEVFLDDEKDYRKYRDKYGSDHVLRFPVVDGTVLMIALDAEQVEDGQVVVTADDLENHDGYLNYLAMTPPGKKISGGVKPVEEPERQGETIYVDVTIFVVNATQAVVESLENMAQMATKHLNPDKNTLQRAVIEREQALEQLAKAKGIEIYRLKSKHTEKVFVEDINWQKLE